MNVLIISQYYPPENTLIAPTLARGLVERGHNVRVLTGYPNYPDGRLFEGYSQQWRSRESVDGIEILRIPLWLDHSQIALRRVMNYASFGVSSATARGFAKSADVIYVYATQMTAAIAAWLWRLTGGAPYVLHIQDLWPDSITGSSLLTGEASRAVERVLTPWIASVYRNAAAVVGIAPTMVQTLVERGVASDRVHMVYNWAEEESVRYSAYRMSDGESAKTNILYGGNIGDLQALDVAVRAAFEARDEGIVLTIIGDGVALPRIQALRDELQATNVRFMGRIPRARMSEHYSRADFALVSLRDLPAFRGTIPSKLQAALSHGVPVISSVQGDVRALVDEQGIGFTADAESVPSLVGAFRAAAALERANWAAMAVCAAGVYASRFSQAAGISALEDILLGAARNRARRNGTLDQEELNANA